MTAPSLSPASPAVDPATAPRVLHFVTGGFSGATQVALDLVQGALASGRTQPLLVLRRKRQTPPEKIAELAARGVPVRVVAGWAHVATIAGLLRVCREFRPQILVAHGFSEHLWGRYAALLADVPVLVHVEHSTRERYTWWRLAQARWLARRTARIVGVSEGVRRRLVELEFPADRCLAIPNGIRLAPFAEAAAHPFAARTPGIVMVARFARQKDHTTLLRAVALLAERGLRPPVLLAGGGRARLRRAAERLTGQLGVREQVTFLGAYPRVPGLLLTHQFCVLCTRHEGMPLALLEGMAAGCAVIGSAVPGVQEIIAKGRNGELVAAGSPRALADVLETLLRDPAKAAALGAAARTTALAESSLELMLTRYEDLFLALARETKPPLTSRPR